jgi:hypothetical protein
MRSDTCLTEQQVQDFQLGNLPEASVDEVAEHLESCPRCEELAQKMDSATDPILAAIRNRPPEFPTKSTLAMKPHTPRLSRPITADVHNFSFLAPPIEAGEIGRLANYRVLRLLDKGGMGYVFHAEDISLCRPVALKVMKPNLDDDSQYAERFLREARIMAAIKHEHLVTIYQAGREGSVVYLAMELLEGEPLGSRLEREGACPADEAFRLGSAIASALAVIHARGLIHRDLKPENIWLEGPRAHVKILDFGLARFVEDDTRLTQPGTIMGTPCFMSPEQARGQEVDARSDLFSLGAVLYCVCTGRRPFEGTSTMAVLTALAVENPRPVYQLNRAIPRGLSDLVMQLLAKNPNDRPQSAEAVLQRLGQSAGRPSDTPVATPVAVTPTPPGRAFPRKTAAALAAALLGVIVAFLAFGPRWGRGPATVPGTSDATAAAPAIQPEDVPAGKTVYLVELPRLADENWFRGPPRGPRKKGPDFRDGKGPDRPDPPDGKRPPPDGKRPPRDGRRPPPDGKRPEPPDGKQWPGPGDGKMTEVRIKGQLMPHSIFMHGSPPHVGRLPSSITYRLGKRFDTLETEVSLNDLRHPGDKSRTEITFSIYGDEKLLWRSTPVVSQEDAQPVAISVKDVEALKIEILCADDDVHGAHAVWIEPRVK